MYHTSSSEFSTSRSISETSDMLWSCAVQFLLYIRHIYKSFPGDLIFFFKKQETALFIHSSFLYGYLCTSLLGFVLIRLYGILIIVGYLMPNLVDSYILDTFDL